MGHSEMLLAVAGLDTLQVAALRQTLASGGIAQLPPAEGLAYSWAYRLTKSPEELTAQDRDELRAVFGGARATDLVWYIAWCNYMTRVADAFQLPLEEENVFAEPQ